MATGLITVQTKFSQQSISLGSIGRVGENVARQILFDCTSALEGRTTAEIVCVIQRPNDKKPYPTTLKRVGNTYTYKLVLTSAEVATAGTVKFELRMLDGEEILKSATHTGTVESSMQGIGDAPGEAIPDALNRLQAVLEEAGEYAALKERIDRLEQSVGNANILEKVQNMFEVQGETLNLNKLMD